MSLDVTLQVVLEITPIPGLSAAFRVFRFIVDSVQKVEDGRKQLGALAKAVGQILTALDAEFTASRLVVAHCGKPLTDLER
jgi:hypothetical protein